jgi:undecaprenyl-diphosphatase
MRRAVTAHAGAGPYPERRARRADDVPALEARRDSPATRAAQAVGNRPPLLVYASVLLTGYVVVAALVVGLGFLLVDVLVPVYAIGHSDEAVNAWLAHNRTGSLDSLSRIGSMIGDVPVLPVLVTLVVVAAAIARRWRVAAFVLGAILVEVGTYRVASMLVHRHRPTVVRLDRLPVEQSFPSGHTAAAVAVYAALAIVLSSIARRRWVTIGAWTVAVVLVAIVASSRMYRGMHHPLDVTSGVLVGVLSIAVALLATRAGDSAARRRATGEGAA